jgi:hypothetical protein
MTIILILAIIGVEVMTGIKGMKNDVRKERSASLQRGGQ